MNDAAEAWFAARGWQPFGFQREVWAAMVAGRSGLLHATTGAGKTYAVWFGALARGEAARTALQVLWITPMRALASDTLKAITAPCAWMVPADHSRCASGRSRSLSWIVGAEASPGVPGESCQGRMCRGRRRSLRLQRLSPLVSHRSLWPPDALHAGPRPGVRPADRLVSPGLAGGLSRHAAAAPDEDQHVPGVPADRSVRAVRGMGSARDRRPRGSGAVSVRAGARPGGGVRRLMHSPERAGGIGIHGREIETPVCEAKDRADRSYRRDADDCCLQVGDLHQYKANRQGLIEEVWPESDPDDGEKKFKVNLHCLRRALEPDLGKAFGSAYIHLKANFVSLDPELCTVDVEEFLSWCKAGETQEKAGDLKDAVSSYARALELYRGDFLAEELYPLWAELRRQELKEKHLGILYRLGNLEEKQGAVTRALDCYRRLLQADPLSEPACQRLMLLYAQRGMRNAALKTYETCCQAIRREIGSEPDEVTTSIYRKILEMPSSH